MQAVILAGGMGTRLKPFTLTSPKPMFPINGKPYIEYLIEQVKSFGIKDILLLLGYLSEQIVDWVESNPHPGVNISYHITPTEYETGARICAAKNLIKEDFLLMYCDNYCPINIKEHIESFHKNDALVQLMAYSNKDGYTKNNLKVIDGKVSIYDKKRLTEGLNAVDIGYAIISKDVLDWLPEGDDLSFEIFVYQRALENSKLYSSITEHRYYSIGSYERMSLTEQFFSGRKAVFLDRDGTINTRPPQACYVESPAEFKWLPGSQEAIALLNKAGWLVLLISNQPGIARGRLSWEQLDAIEKKMIADLKEHNARIDKFYYCPHNWDEGCDCRKPKPGMLYQAQKDFNLNIPTDCVLIGDDDRDIEAAVRANCKALQVSNEYTFPMAVNDLLGGLI